LRINGVGEGVEVFLECLGLAVLFILYAEDVAVGAAPQLLEDLETRK
jgi:hypothetical protein